MKTSSGNTLLHLLCLGILNIPMPGEEDNTKQVGQGVIGWLHSFAINCYYRFNKFDNVSPSCKCRKTTPSILLPRFAFTLRKGQPDRYLKGLTLLAPAVPPNVMDALLEARGW